MGGMFPLDDEEEEGSVPQGMNPDLFHHVVELLKRHSVGDVEKMLDGAMSKDQLREIGMKYATDHYHNEEEDTFVPAEDFIQALHPSQIASLMGQDPGGNVAVTQPDAQSQQSINRDMQDNFHKRLQNYYRQERMNQYGF